MLCVFAFSHHALFARFALASRSFCASVRIITLSRLPLSLSMVLDRADLWIPRITLSWFGSLRIVHFTFVCVLFSSRITLLPRSPLVHSLRTTGLYTWSHASVGWITRTPRCTDRTRVLLAHHARTDHTHTLTRGSVCTFISLGSSHTHLAIWSGSFARVQFFLVCSIVRICSYSFASSGSLMDLCGSPLSFDRLDLTRFHFGFSFSGLSVLDRLHSASRMVWMVALAVARSHSRTHTLTRHTLDHVHVRTSHRTAFTRSAHITLRTFAVTCTSFSRARSHHALRSLDLVAHCTHFGSHSLVLADPRSRLHAGSRTFTSAFHVCVYLTFASLAHHRGSRCARAPADLCTHSFCLRTRLLHSHACAGSRTFASLAVWIAFSRFACRTRVCGSRSWILDRFHCLHLVASRVARTLLHTRCTPLVLTFMVFLYLAFSLSRFHLDGCALWFSRICLDRLDRFRSFAQFTSRTLCWFSAFTSFSHASRVYAVTFSWITLRYVLHGLLRSLHCLDRIARTARTFCTRALDRTARWFSHAVCTLFYSLWICVCALWITSLHWFCTLSLVSHWIASSLDPRSSHWSSFCSSRICVSVCVRLLTHASTAFVTVTFSPRAWSLHSHFHFLAPHARTRHTFLRITKPRITDRFLAFHSHAFRVVFVRFAHHVCAYLDPGCIFVWSHGSPRVLVRLTLLDPRTHARTHTHHTHTHARISDARITLHYAFTFARLGHTARTARCTFTRCTHAHTRSGSGSRTQFATRGHALVLDHLTLIFSHALHLHVSRFVCISVWSRVHVFTHWIALLIARSLDSLPFTASAASAFTWTARFGSFTRILHTGSRLRTLLHTSQFVLVFSQFTLVLAFAWFLFSFCARISRTCVCYGLLDRGSGSRRGIATPRSFTHSFSLDLTPRTAFTSVTFHAWILFVILFCTHVCSHIVLSGLSFTHTFHSHVTLWIVWSSRSFVFTFWLHFVHCSPGSRLTHARFLGLPRTDLHRSPAAFTLAHVHVHWV